MEVSNCWKIVEITKISIKMKNCNTFYEVQKTSRLNEIIQSSPTHFPSDKILLRLFLRRYTEINGHLLSKCFKNAVLGVKKRWSANVFSDTKQKHVCWKILLNSERFWLYCKTYYFQCELRFVKWVRFFERNCIVKLVIFFGSFCWLWLFLNRWNSEDVH